MIRSFSIYASFICLISVPAWAQYAAAGIIPLKKAEASAVKTTAAERVSKFAATHNISSWPRLDGCDYDRAFTGETVGLILTIESATAARARWDGRCHVPMRHELTGIPEELANGQYVVAATSLESDPYSSPNSRLQVIGILGDLPDDGELLDAAMAQICTPVAGAKETDHDCRDRNRKR